jgi:hypothetical protein
MRILFLGSEDTSATSRHRSEAFRRLGHQVRHLDPLVAFAEQLRGNAGRLHYHTGYSLLRGAVTSWLKRSIPDSDRFDACWVDGGEMLGAGAVAFLKSHSERVILFNHDDPTGPRDWQRFRTLRSAIPEYDLCAVVRPFNVVEFQSQGGRKVVSVLRTYDEVAHAPPSDQTPVSTELKSDVAFIGGNYKGEGRDQFLAELIDRGLGVAIWGGLWERSPIWNRLKASWRGPGLSGRAYVDAIRGSKVCLGLLSSRNRDEHTTRSMEIPYAGGLLCAQRTPEHEGLYRDGHEAVFWASVDECYEVCSRLLADDEARERIRSSGMIRVRQNGVGNETLIARLLSVSNVPI